MWRNISWWLSGTSAANCLGMLHPERCSPAFSTLQRGKRKVWKDAQTSEWCWRPHCCGSSKGIRDKRWWTTDKVSFVSLVVNVSLRLLSPWSERNTHIIIGTQTAVLHMYKWTCYLDLQPTGRFWTCSWYWTFLASKRGWVHPHCLSRIVLPTPLKLSPKVVHGVLTRSALRLHSKAFRD